jgi:N5-(cytidine 5'-diphosphoramidyl)-L-glutamine hydrolase
VSRQPILTSQRLTAHETYHEIREALDIRVAEFLSKCGFLTVPVPLHAINTSDFNSIRPFGILLTGGNDLACVAPDNALSLARDSVDRSLIDYGLENNIPIFGFCRGMQMIAYYFSGKLNRCDHHAGTRHAVTVTPNTLLHTTHPETMNVNSYHDFSVVEINKDLFHISALAENGVIEAIEHRVRPIMGIMWHPERNTHFLSEDLNLFKSFFTRKLAPQ